MISACNLCHLSQDFLTDCMQRSVLGCGQALGSNSWVNLPTHIAAAKPKDFLGKQMTRDVMQPVVKMLSLPFVSGQNQRMNVELCSRL